MAGNGENQIHLISGLENNDGDREDIDVGEVEILSCCCGEFVGAILSVYYYFWE